MRRPLFEMILWCPFLHIYRWEHLVYQFGCHSDIIKYVIKAGRVVHSNEPKTTQS